MGSASSSKVNGVVISNIEKSTMPWFRKQSDKSKKKLQHQLYLAREDPGPVFDLSSCEISDIPQGVFSLCKVLQKEVLLVHTNWLTAITGGGNLKDLAHLRVLDLHHNELVTLPDDLGFLTGLEVLNVSHNKLKELPVSLGHLSSLQSLHAQENKLKELPASVCDLESITTLDISSNYVHSLPAELSQVRTLQTLTLDASSFTYPSPDICKSGTEAIMQLLCKDNDIVYIPPGQVRRQDARQSTSTRHQQLQDEAQHVNRSLKQYEAHQDRKRKELWALEQQLQQEKQLQAQVAAMATKNRQHLVEYMAQDDARRSGELSAIQQQRDTDRSKLVTNMQQEERSADELVKQLLELSERSRRTEELMETMERERMEMDKWWEVRQEEIETLRKNDVIVNMEKVLVENAWMNQVIQNALQDRDQNIRRTQQSNMYEREKLSILLSGKDADKIKLVSELLREESLQKEAFEALQMQKDAKHQRIRSQIELIEQELAQLTQLEVQQRHLKLNLQMTTLADKRQTLTQLLIQLMEERDKREGELKRRLIEIEEQNENTQSDYWLVQYQRLMDRKPQAMFNMEKRLELSVCEILDNASASDYAPLFARHRISIETLLQIDDIELAQMGVHEMGLRKNILRCIEKYKKSREEEMAAAKAKGIENQQDKDEWLVKPPEPIMAPRAPAPAGAPGDDVTAPQAAAASAPPASAGAVQEVTAHFSSECVVCMEFTSSVLFLQCGHICCCTHCAGALTDCPLCRATIAHKITLKHTRKILNRDISQHD